MTLDRSRPIRLRQACNNCCVAKVKCSGERTGCERCRNNVSQCLYQESRVGKVQGNRRRKQSETITPYPPGDRTGLTVVPPLTPALSQDTTFLDTGHDDMLTWSNGLQLGSSDSDYLNDSALSNMDFSINELLQTPPATEEPVANDLSTRQRMPLSLAMQPRNEQDSQCVLECIRIISDVESYIMADLRSFKILLGIIRKALNSLKTLVGLQQGSRNLRCLFLFSTVMYQVLEMLESCFANVQRESNTGQGLSTTASPLGTPKPSPGFEAFGMDPEELSEWRLQMILKEVNHTIDVSKKIKTLAGVGPDEDETRGDDSSVSRQGCYFDLELRLHDLNARISGSG